MRGLPSKACPNHQALLIRACHHHLRSHSGQKSHLHAARDSTSEEGGGTFCLHHLHPQRHENQEISAVAMEKVGSSHLPWGKTTVSMAKNPCEKPGLGKLASSRCGFPTPKTRNRSWSISSVVGSRPPQIIWNWEDASFAAGPLVSPWCLNKPLSSRLMVMNHLENEGFVGYKWRIRNDQPCMGPLQPIDAQSTVPL